MSRGTPSLVQVTLGLLSARQAQSSIELRPGWSRPDTGSLVMASSGKLQGPKIDRDYELNKDYEVDGEYEVRDYEVDRDYEMDGEYETCEIYKGEGL